MLSDMDGGLLNFLLQKDQSCPLYMVLVPFSLLGLRDIPCLSSTIISLLGIQDKLRVVLVTHHNDNSEMLRSCTELLSGLILGGVRLFKGAKTFVILGNWTQWREPCLALFLRRTL